MMQYSFTDRVVEQQEAQLPVSAQSGRELSAAFVTEGIAGEVECVKSATAGRGGVGYDVDGAGWCEVGVG